MIDERGSAVGRSELTLIKAMGDEQRTTYTAKDGKLSPVDLETGGTKKVDYTTDRDTLVLGVDGEKVLRSPPSPGAHGVRSRMGSKG